jgi:hypothetical protein
MRRKKWDLARRAAASAAWTVERREAMREAAKARWAAAREFEADKKEVVKEFGEKAKELEEEAVTGISGLAGVRRMLVRKVCVNPRLVEGELVGGDGQVEYVDVGRNGTIAIGDELLVRRSKEALELWEFAGMADSGLAVDILGLPRDRRRVR